MFKPEWKVFSVHSSDDGTFFVLEVPRQWPKRGEDPAELDKWFESVGLGFQQFDEQTLRVMAQAECDRRNAEGFELPEDPTALDPVAFEGGQSAWIHRVTSCEMQRIHRMCWEVKDVVEGFVKESTEDTRWHVGLLEQRLERWEIFNRTGDRRTPSPLPASTEALWDHHHKELLKLAIQMGRDYLAKKERE